MSPHRFGLLAGLAFLAMSSCSGCGIRTTLVDPDVPYWAVLRGFVPAGAYPVQPSPMWLAEYKAAEECSGLKGNPGVVVWYLVPGNGFKMPVEQEDGSVSMLLFVGLSDRGRIYISESRKHFEWVIRHESLHDILQGGGHNVSLFGEKCKAMQGWFD